MGCPASGSTGMGGAPGGRTQNWKPHFRCCHSRHPCPDCCGYGSWCSWWWEAASAPHPRHLGLKAVQAKEPASFQVEEDRGWGVLSPSCSFLLPCSPSFTKSGRLIISDEFPSLSRPTDALSLPNPSLALHFRANCFNGGFKVHLNSFTSKQHLFSVL